MLCGIVDIGSNTIRLSIYSVENGNVKLLINKKETAGLSSYIKKGKMSRAGIDIACETLEEYQSILDNFGIPDLRVFATAPLRNILNSEEAKAAIAARTGIQVDVLSGKEEASLDFVAASHIAEIRDGILIDIGGGSTEIVEFRHGTVLATCSLPLGTLTLYLNHVKGILPSKKKFREIQLDVATHLKEFEILKSSPYPTVHGVGGTVRAAARLNNVLFGLPSCNSEFPAQNLEDMLDRFQNSGKLALETILRNAPARVHTLLPGMIILHTIAATCRSQTIQAHSFGIREGYLFGRVLGDT